MTMPLLLTIGLWVLHWSVAPVASARSGLALQRRTCPAAAIRVSVDSVAYLPIEKATFAQLRALCPAAFDTFDITPSDAVFEPAVAFPFAGVTVVAVQTRNEPGAESFRVVDGKAIPDYWLVPAARGASFNEVSLYHVTWGQLEQAFGRGSVQLGADDAEATICRFPNVVFVLDLGDIDPSALPDPGNWHPPDHLTLLQLQLGSAVRRAAVYLCH